MMEDEIVYVLSNKILDIRNIFSAITVEIVDLTAFISIKIYSCFYT